MHELKIIRLNGDRTLGGKDCSRGLPLSARSSE